MENNFHKAYKEIIELLKYMPKEKVEKIPENMLYTFKTKMDTKHQFEIDPKKPLEKQDFLKETKDILSNLYRDYWATPEQREKILAKEKIEKQKVEEEKRRKDNLRNIYSTYVNPEPKDPFAENGISYKKEKNFMNSDTDLDELRKINKQIEKNEKLYRARSNADNEILMDLEEKEHKRMQKKAEKKWYGNVVDFFKKIFGKK